jgi:preprotein translocase subunit SecA
VIYADRRAVLERADLHERVLGMIRAEIQRIVDMNIPSNVINEEEELEHLFNALETWVHIPEDVLPENLHSVRKNDLVRKLTDLVIDHYEERGRQLDTLVDQNAGLGIPTIRDLERSYTLQVIDRLWMDHIHAVDTLRNSIGFRAVAQRDPLVEFKNEAFRMFEDLKLTIQHYIVDSLLKLLRDNITIRVQQPAPKRKVAAPRTLRTNAEDIARASGQAKSDGASSAGRNGAGARSNVRAPVATSAPRPAPAKIGRNDPCPCGSGKKYKKCHGA